jgi:NitT/TauT family transport system substrate-binding protein
MMINRRDALFGASAVAGAGMLPAQAYAAGSPATLAFGPSSAIYSLGKIALEKGFFEKEGVDLKLVIGNAGTHGRQALAAGQALYAHGDASHSLQLSNRGKKCRIIMASQMIASISNIVVRKDLFDAGIKTVEDLAAYKRPDGSKPIVAATAIGAGTWMYGTYVFESKKLSDKINWVAGGGPKTLFPGLETKQFDAIMAVPSWVIEAEDKNFGRVIYDTSKKGVFTDVFGGTVPVLVLYTLEETTKDEKAKTQSFVNAMYQAMLWTRTAPIDEVYALVGKKYYDGYEKATKVELAFDRDTWAFNGRIEKADFERGGKVWYRAGTDIPPTTFEDIVDMSFLDAAQAKFK